MRIALALIALTISFSLFANAEIVRFSLHPKSGCFSDNSLEGSSNEACQVLALQIPELEAWIEAGADAGEEFIQLGGAGPVTANLWLGGENRITVNAAHAVPSELDHSMRAEHQQTDEGIN